MRSLSHATRTLFAVLVAAGLAFGATTAFAKPASATGECFGDSIGACTSTAACNAACNAAGGIPNQGVCSNGCCYCAF